MEKKNTYGFSTYGLENFFFCLSQRRTKHIGMCECCVKGIWHLIKYEVVSMLSVQKSPIAFFIKLRISTSFWVLYLFLSCLLYFRLTYTKISEKEEKIWKKKQTYNSVLQITQNHYSPIAWSVDSQYSNCSFIRISPDEIFSN